MSSRQWITEPGGTSTNDVTVADELFGALDGQVVTSDDARWRISICGIHPDHEQYWVQLMLVGPEQYAATFGIDPERPSELLREVTTALDSPALTSAVSRCPA